MITIKCKREALDIWLIRAKSVFGCDKATRELITDYMQIKNGGIVPITFQIDDDGKMITATANAKLKLTAHRTLLVYALDNSYHEEREEM